MDTRRCKPLKNHQRTTPQNHSRFLNFDLRILKNATLKPPAASKSLPRHPPERPLSGSQKGPEKDHPQHRTNSEHTVRRTHEKEGVASPTTHSPFSLTLPLSSFGWLRNNSSSRRKRPVRASVKSSPRGRGRARRQGENESPDSTFES